MHGGSRITLYFREGHFEWAGRVEESNLCYLEFNYLSRHFLGLSFSYG